MNSSDSDSDSDWNRELLTAVSKKRGKGAGISERDRCRQMQECLDQGANIDTVGKNGNTVLHVAVKKGYKEVVKFLRRNGARTDIRNQQGGTAITLAEILNELEIASILKDPIEQQNQQAVHRPRSVTEFTSVDDEEPSTSRGRNSPGSAAKRRLSIEDKCDERVKKLRLALDDTPELDITVNTDSRRTNTSGEPPLRRKTERIIQAQPFDGQKTYAASGLKRSLHGVVYQWKHLMLIIHRAWKMGCAFRLATEMDAAEKFDDVVLEYEVSPGNKVHRFIQLKHKQETTDCKMVSANHLLDVKDGEFSILKYFISWRKIMRNSDFSGSRSKKFILCTNIGLDVEGLKDKNIEVSEVGESDGFLNVTVKTERPPRFYKLLDRPSELSDTMKLASDIHILARELAERICSSKDIYLNNEIIKCYHAALAQEVIDVENRKFFLHFIRNNNLSAKAKKFRKIFFFHVKTFSPRNVSEIDIWKNLEGTPLKLSTNFGTKFELGKPELTHVGKFSDEFVKLVINASNNKVVKIDRRVYRKRASDLSIERIFADNIDKLAGHVLITEDKKLKFRSQFLNDVMQLQGNIEEFKDALKTRLGSNFDELYEYEFEINNFKTCTEEELYSRTELPDDEIGDAEISAFLDAFSLAVNQPNEKEIGEMVKLEIGAYSQFNLLNVDFIGDSFQNEIVGWLKKTEKYSTFLYNDDASAFFTEIERELSSLITVGLNLPYSAELKKYDIKFEGENKNLQEFLGKCGSTVQPILKMVSFKQTFLTALRVYQTLARMKKYEKQDIFIFIHLGKMLVPEITEQVLRAFQSPHSHDLLIIDCESISANQDAQRLWNRLCGIINANPRKKMVLVIEQKSEWALQLQMNCQTFHEELDDISIVNLYKSSRQKLLEKRIVKFQGQDERTSFGKLLGIYEFDDIDSEKLNDLGRVVDPNTLVQLIQDEEITIGSEAGGLGEIGNYYIPRTIVQHVVIRVAVLQDRRIPDLFAIDGINHGALRTLVATEKGGQLYNTESYMNKCFILKNGREEHHFETICEQNSNHNIHWLQSRSGKLLWVQSYGKITDLMKFKETSKDFDDNDRPGETCLTEDQLAKHNEQRKIVILSDTAGMGKSTVLTHLAGKMKQNEAHVLVIRVDLTRHTTVLHEEQKKRTFDENDTQGAVEFLVEKLLSSSDGVERELFKSMIMKTGETALLFDGFDEISPNYEDTVIDLLQALAILHIKKLIITTRPHTSKVLENKFEIFSHKLQPFSEENQIEFLTKFWGSGITSNDFVDATDESLQKHARAVLKILSKSINPQMQEFTGVPLQTRLVAEVFPYEKDSKLQRFDPSNETLDSEGDVSKLPEAIDIIDLYKYFVDKKYRIFCKEKKSGDQTNLAEIKDTHITNQMFLIAHQKLALDALFGEVIVKALLCCQPEIDIMYSLFQNRNEGEERTGIVVQVINGKPHFIHRTFAEYFAAIFLIKTLKDDCRNQKMRRFFVAELFIRPEFKTIRAFMNYLLIDRDNALQQESWKLNLKIHCNERRQTLYHVAASEVNVEIVRFFINRLVENHEHKIPPTIIDKSLEQEADINIPDESTKTALTIAADVSRNLDLVACFIEGGADVNYQWQNGYTALHCAARQAHNLNVVKYLVEKGANIDSQEKDGRTPLYYAVTSPGNLDVVKYLVGKGANIESQGKEGFTLVYYAVSTAGNLDVVKYLTEIGASIDSPGKNGRMPLHHAAAIAGNLDVVKYLVEKGVGIDSQDQAGRIPLHYAAAASSDLDVVKYLVEKSSSIDYPGKEGDTPLHHAAAETVNLDIVKYLVERGASIDSQTTHGSTPLHYAASTVGNLDIVEYLVEKGAGINSQEKNGSTPLHNAAWKARNLEVVKYLVDKGASINSRGKDGDTPLHAAVQEAGNLDVVKCLVEKGASIDSQGKDGNTPLHYAVCQKENLVTVKYLVKKGASIDSQEKDGNTPLHYAARQNENLDVVNYLIEKGASVNSQTHHGCTPLHYAAPQMFNLDVVKYLIENGASINSQMRNGCTPLHYAAKETRNLDVVKYLVEKGAIVESQTQLGCTPLHYAARTIFNLDVVRYLVEMGASIESQTQDGCTPLHYAAQQAYNIDVVKFLVEKGGNINSRGKDGSTPLRYASEIAKDSNTVKYLKSQSSNVISQTESRYDAALEKFDWMNVTR